MDGDKVNGNKETGNRKYGISPVIVLLSVLVLCFLLPASLPSASAFGPSLRTKWVTKLKKEGWITKRPFQFSVPVYDDGKLYVGTASGYIYQIDAIKGHKDWMTKLSGAVYAEPAVDGASVYVADRKGMVYSIERSTGKIEWQVDSSAEISSRPVVTDDTVYFATVLRQIVAISKNGTGKRWQTTKTGSLPAMTVKGSSSPVLYNGNIYVGYADGLIVCYRTSDGSPVWSRQLSNKEAMFMDVDSTPLIENGIIYVASVDGKTYALDPKDGAVLWKANRGGPNDLAVDESNVYVSGGGKLVALRKDSGAVVWEKDFQEPEVSAPVIKDGFIGIASTRDKLYIVDAKDGNIRYERFMGKGSFGKPVIVGNMIYLFSNSSKLFALEGSS